jgi:hypothetical protein
LIALVAASALAGEAGLKPRTLILLASTECYFPASKTFGGGLVYPDSTVAARSGRLESVESKCGVVTLAEHVCFRPFRLAVRHRHVGA